MSNLTSLKQVKQRSLTTIQTEKDGTKFIKIPVENYEDLELMRVYLTRAISYICEAEFNGKNEDINFTIKHLTRLLYNMNCLEDVEVLDWVSENTI